MPHPGVPTGVSDADLIKMWSMYGTAGTARRMKCSERNVNQRLARLRLKGNDVRRPGGAYSSETLDDYPECVRLDVENGIVLVASDAHYWPGPATLMHKAFVHFCKEFKPRAVIFNGDVIDAPQVSRHPPLNWEKIPELADEIEAAKDRLFEIEKAAFKALKIWTVGNHDARFERRLAQVAPEYARLHGMHLKDHFPDWQPALLALINDDVVVKHRFKGGTHHTHSDTLWAGKTIVTGHLHSAKVTPFDDYNGTRYGVDGGCLAEPRGRQFMYTEGNPTNWRSAFVVLTFKAGQLMYPELVLKWSGDQVQFRGEVIRP